jgi:phage-related minor tail protein
VPLGLDKWAATVYKIEHLRIRLSEVEKQRERMERERTDAENMMKSMHTDLMETYGLFNSMRAHAQSVGATADLIKPFDDVSATVLKRQKKEYDFTQAWLLRDINNANMIVSLMHKELAVRIAISDLEKTLTDITFDLSAGKKLTEALGH